MPIRRLTPFALVVSVAVSVGIVAACDAKNPGPDSPTGAGNHRVMAVQQVIGNRTVRWISERELCVVPFDAASIPECVARPKPVIPATELRALRETLGPPSGPVAQFACVSVSRPITQGESTLVVVSMVGDVEADGVVESSVQWVWFPRRGTGARGRARSDPYDGASDVARMTDAGQC